LLARSLSGRCVRLTLSLALRRRLFSSLLGFESSLSLFLLSSRALSLAISRLGLTLSTLRGCIRPPLLLALALLFSALSGSFLTSLSCSPRCLASLLRACLIFGTALLIGRLAISANLRLRRLTGCAQISLLLLSCELRSTTIGLSFQARRCGGCASVGLNLGRTHLRRSSRLLLSHSLRNGLRLLLLALLLLRESSSMLSRNLRGVLRLFLPLGLLLCGNLSSMRRLTLSRRLLACIAPSLRRWRQSERAEIAEARKTVHSFAAASSATLRTTEVFEHGQLLREAPFSGRACAA
jgi:hypothetical protein